MKQLILALLLLSSIQAFAQDNLTKIAAQIEARGRELYRLEMAAWHGTDLMLEKSPEIRSKGGGYLSYALDDETHFIYFSKGDKPQVIFDIAFEHTFDLSKATITLTERPFTKLETKLHAARLVVAKRIKSDTTFTYYENTAYNINLIPSKKGIIVYILTGPQVSGVVFIGNDYKLVLDKKNRVKSVEKIHKKVAVFKYNGKEKGETSAHIHTGKRHGFITPTDVCTLLLYGKFVNWSHHAVISDKFVSSWDFKTERLTILSKEVWENIMKPKE